MRFAEKFIVCGFCSKTNVNEFWERLFADVERFCASMTDVLNSVDFMFYIAFCQKQNFCRIGNPESFLQQFIGGRCSDFFQKFQIVTVGNIYSQTTLFVEFFDAFVCLREVIINLIFNILFHLLIEVFKVNLRKIYPATLMVIG